MKNFKYIILVIFALSFFGCKKNQLGGKSDIKGKVMHHDLAIPNARVYIKYNATEFPGADVSVYDDKVTADANAHYEFKGLRITPNVYTTLGELNRFCDVMENVSKNGVPKT